MVGKNIAVSRRNKTTISDDSYIAVQATEVRNQREGKNSKNRGQPFCVRQLDANYSGLLWLDVFTKVAYSHVVLDTAYHCEQFFSGAAYSGVND